MRMQHAINRGLMAAIMPLLAAAAVSMPATGAGAVSYVHIKKPFVRSAPRWAYVHRISRAPGYVFVPGRGIVNEACNLPTSACPNTLRDVQ